MFRALSEYCRAGAVKKRLAQLKSIPRRYLLSGLLLAVILTSCGLGGLFWLWVNHSLDAPLQFEGEHYTLMVAPGDSLSLLAKRLDREGLVASRYPLMIHARCCVDGVIHAGEYDLPRGETSRALVARLLQGRVVLHRITFPEGKTLHQWLAILHDTSLLDSTGFEQVADIARLVNEVDSPSPEGWFFPDTYSFHRGQDAGDILLQAHQRMRALLTEEWPKRDPGLPLQTPYEALILASIVEKETAIAAERPAIAGVFIRRLQKGMRLQTDPTVIYGLGQDFDGNLTRQHLRGETPYNTYVIKGLPPTPIANPGREAVLAVLHPEEGDSLFFVARGDGSHQFSKTLAQHQRAVRQYQLKRRSDYRSTPQAQ